ncbi:family 43 glycosylhydrolase [Pedobacter sp. BS3]|nr:family 43 glycosylhydrolase [Pedobacter sp. BS3]
MDTTFTNPVGGGADPWVIKDGGYYYVCLSAGNNGVSHITVSKSTSLTKIGPRKIVWTAPASGWNSHCVWAPELHRIGKKWYIYYAAGQSGPPYKYQRSGVLESVTDDPQGEYIDKGMLKTGADPNDPTGTIWAIDLTVTSIRGKLYAVWSGWEQNASTDKTSQHLYMARMSNPWTISSERVKISSPDQPWETGGPLDLNEGPEFLKHDGKVFIIYSTRESWTPQYRLGMLMLKDDKKSPMDATNWIKKGPVFRGTKEVLGPGHASFTTSPDGKEWWIFYHAKKTTKPGWARNLRLQKFTWDKDGNPVFGTPVPAGIPIPLPSGEKQE